MKKIVFSKIAEPLPILLPRSNFHNIPKITCSQGSQALGVVNGRPFKEIFEFEQDLLQYLKNAYVC
jgi:hypothetical protein